MTNVELLGDERLSAELTAGARALADLSGIHAKAARTVRGTAQPATPRRTGRLAASLRERATPTSGAVASGLVYAPVVHWGWPGHNIEANPWLWNAAKRTQPKWLSHYQKEIERIVSDCAGGIR